MPRARCELVDVASTPWYHVVSRCVRRAYLCGEDVVSGRSYEHRRGWLTDRIRQLAGVFALDVAAYAVMSNHFHLVLHVDVDRARSWEVDQVLQRWTQVFAGPEVVRQYLQDPGVLVAAQIDLVHAYAETYRERLADLSWYMRVLNESIARMANAEDGVTGRFWEGRFKSQALLDEAGVLTAMAYVDLNPIRARMAATPEASEYTSVAERLAALMANGYPQPGAAAPVQRNHSESRSIHGRIGDTRSPASHGVQLPRIEPLSEDDRVFRGQGIWFRTLPLPQFSAARPREPGSAPLSPDSFRVQEMTVLLDRKRLFLLRGQTCCPIKSEAGPAVTPAKAGVQ